MPNTVENYVPQTALEKMRRRAIFAWSVFTALAVIWVFVIVLAPLAAANDWANVSQPIYKFFSFLCHQDEARSFHLYEHAFAVCSRCFGIYAGLAAGAFVYPFLRRIEDTEPFPRFWLFLAMIPMAIDWSLGFFEILENTHFSRFLTGVILGAVCGVFIVPAIIEVSEFLSNKRIGKRLSR